jgi:hydroxymethylglutaryl-CoA lyase
MYEIEFIEVGPRDGLQNEKVLVSTDDKLALINRAVDAGIRRVEVTSFVNPKRVPQMADAEEVCAGLQALEGVTYIGLVLNLRGAERAIATGKINQMGAVSIATDQFAIANQGQSSDESVEASKAIIIAAKAAGLTGQATISTAFGCPFEGEVSEDRVVAIADALAQTDPVEIALADTIGVANPMHVARLVTRVKQVIAPIPVRVHFHNTRGTGLANVWAAIEAGATRIDASIGGLGGCPFAPGATGNVCSEDVLFMLERAGIQTGVDLGAMIAANRWMSEIMGKELPGMLAKAPAFPAAQ